VAATCESFLRSYYRLRPVNATFTGIHDFDGVLPDWSPEGLESGRGEMQSLRHALIASRPPDSSLANPGARDRELAIACLDVQIAEYDSLHFQRANPSLAIAEAIFGVISLMIRPFAPVTQRAGAAIARLRAIPNFLSGARRSVQRPLPDGWRTRCVRECEGADRLLGDGISRWIAGESIHAADAGRLIDAARLARAAFVDLRRWLAETSGGDAGAYACGSDLFDLVLSHGHWCDRPRASLAREAADGLNEALDLLDRRARRIAAGGWPEVQASLMDEHPTIEEYLPTYLRVWNACRERARQCDLVTWPEYPIRYVPIPVWTRDAAPHLYYLLYRSPAPFDRLPSHDYVVTAVEPDLPADEQRRRLRANNSSVITLNHVVHHGAIGHHVQNYYAYAGESQIGKVAAVDCASRIGMVQGGTMAEGWACYATDVMDEVGFFTPEQSVAQQHTRARLLARAVVDIGLHEQSMSFDDAVRLYCDRIGMTAEAARSEACKNSMFPGTGLMYWLGTDAIHRLRRDRQRIEGSSFSLRRFHDRLLAFGSVPVPLISQVYS
jgi:uncharacterized protein DUF885